MDRALNEEFMTVAECAQWLHCKPKTIRNRMCNGVYVQGVHYYSPSRGSVVFVRAAMLAWLKGEAVEHSTYPVQRS